ncbi:MAG: hypothetical protein NT070_09595 [Cyanobacteria bacterium]|nr:hypothetical protein [Cyanobacteriota bacterium]
MSCETDSVCPVGQMIFPQIEAAPYPSPDRVTRQDDRPHFVLAQSNESW